MSGAHAADEAAIREQAYLLWEQEGRPAGREVEFWTRAEVAVAGKGQLDTLTKGPPKTAKAGSPKKSAAGTKMKAAASTMKAPPARTTAKTAAKPKKK